MARARPLLWALCASPVPALRPSLPPPSARVAAAGCTELLVPVSSSLSLVLLEADAASQQRLVEDALGGAPTPAGEDPYGMVLWPAAQVAAAALAHELALAAGPCAVTELGAGTGLCSLCASALGAAALATDYRPEPLALLHRSAAANVRHLGVRHLGGALASAVFDITSDEPLPRPEAPEAEARVLVAADLLYFRSTSVALARRCVEALRSEALVLVGDCGRPGRDAFLAELVRRGVRPERARFTSVAGWGAPAPRHELVTANSGPAVGAGGPGRPQECRAQRVGLLRLSSADLGGAAVSR